MDPYFSPPPQPAPGADYLDSIAPTDTKKTLNPLVLWALIAGALLLVGGIVMAILSGGPSQEKQIEAVAYELQSLQSLTDEQQQYIQSSTLRGINSSLTLLLTNANHDIAEPLAKNNLQPPGDQPPQDASVPAEFDALKSRLDDARLNAVFDRTYARELSYQLDKMLIEMNDLYQATDSSSLKQFLKTTHDNLSPLQKQFATFKGDGA